MQHASVVKARKKVMDACRAARKAAGQHLMSSTHAQVEAACDAGYTFICLDTDTTLLGKAARAAIPPSIRKGDSLSAQMVKPQNQRKS
jgi:2-keto-3-deoxy-L-rhamnonate aldolase RhmA